MEKDQGHRATALNSEGRCRDAEAIDTHHKVYTKGQKKQTMNISMHCKLSSYEISIAVILVW